MRYEDVIAKAELRAEGMDLADILRNIDRHFDHEYHQKFATGAELMEMPNAFLDTESWEYDVPAYVGLETYKYMSEEEREAYEWAADHWDEEDEEGRQACIGSQYEEERLMEEEVCDAIRATGIDAMAAYIAFSSNRAEMTLALCEYYHENGSYYITHKHLLFIGFTETQAHEIDSAYYEGDDYLDSYMTKLAAIFRAEDEQEELQEIIAMPAEQPRQRARSI